MEDRGQKAAVFARIRFRSTVRISDGGERTHPASLLPDGLDRHKEFRFGGHQPFPVGLIVPRK
jgi:hypothetical protein